MGTWEFFLGFLGSCAELPAQLTHFALGISEQFSLTSPGWLRPQEPEGGRALPSWARLSGCAGDAAGAPQRALVLGEGTVVCSKGPDKLRLQADGKKLN